MILWQNVVSGDTKYSFSNVGDMIIFDIHNDSPYNIGVSFGSDTGILQADFYSSPHSILYGISPASAKQRSIGGVKFSGTVYMYTQTPSGGGTTNLASAPASMITVVGYPAGYSPNGTTSLSRLTNTGNPVSTVSGISTAIQNDTNAAGASIVEATVSGDSNSAVSWTNSAVLKNGNSAHPGSVSFDNAKIASDGAGNLTVNSLAGTWQSNTASEGLTNVIEAVSANIGNYNANGLVPQATNLGIALCTKDNTGTVQQGLTINPAGTEVDMSACVVHGALTVTSSSSLDNGALTTDGSGNILFHGKLGVASAGDVIDASTGADTYIKCRSGGNINFQSPNGTTAAHFDSSGLLNVIHSINLVNGSIGQLTKFSGTGSGTVSTGITNPSAIAFNPCTASGSSQTIGGTTASSSVVTTGSGLAWMGTAWHA
jgi:hypothetical protein